MAALAAGDRLALSGLIALMGHGVQTFAAHQLILPSEAEDVAQETFLRVWAQARGYDPARGAVSTWVYRITVNLCIDRNRKHRLWRFIGLETAAELEDPVPDTETALDDRQNLARASAALRRLPDRQRRVLLLRVLADQSTAEIAQTLSISAGAVEQLLVRARAGLKVTLASQRSPEP